jgi:hypothetical protein
MADTHTQLLSCSQTASAQPVAHRPRWNVPEQNGVDFAASKISPDFCLIATFVPRLGIHRSWLPLGAPAIFGALAARAHPWLCLCWEHWKRSERGASENRPLRAGSVRLHGYFSTRVGWEFLSIPYERDPSVCRPWSAMALSRSLLKTYIYISLHKPLCSSFCAPEWLVYKNLNSTQPRSAPHLPLSSANILLSASFFASFSCSWFPPYFLTFFFHVRECFPPFVTISEKSPICWCAMRGGTAALAFEILNTNTIAIW